MTKSEEILKNTEARYIVEENKGQSKVAIYYHEEDVEKAISQSLTTTDVSQQRELLIAFAKYMEEDKMYARHDEANADDFLENYSN